MIPLGHRSLRVVEVRDDDAISHRGWWLRTWPKERLAASVTFRGFEWGRAEEAPSA